MSTPQEQRLQARADLKRDLAQAKDAMARMRLLIDSPHAPKLVPTLPAQDLYLIVKTVGLSDSLELLHLTSPGQFQRFIDLEVWRGGVPERGSLLQWLKAARLDDDDERWRGKFAGLDGELIDWLLKGALVLHDLEVEPDPHTEGTIWRSPEGRYLLEFTVDGADYIAMKGLLDDLYATNPLEAVRRIESTRWALASELEESALRWRDARLGDLGFPSLDEAQSFFAWVDPDAPLPALDRPVALPEGLVATRLGESTGLFTEALKRLDDETRALLSRQLVGTLNAALVANRIEPGEPEAVAEALRDAERTLSLGLEYRAKGSVEAAARILETAPLKRLFQVGFSLGLRLKFQAERLVKARGGGGEARFESPLAETIAALRRKRPMLCEAAIDPLVPPERMRPFATVREIEAVAATLTAAGG